jgi:hypothetical protein
MAEKMSKAQRSALEDMSRAESITAYGAGYRLDTLSSLENRKLARAERGVGSMAFPHTTIRWRITDLGRAALQKDTTHG